MSDQSDRPAYTAMTLSFLCDVVVDVARWLLSIATVTLCILAGLSLITVVSLPTATVVVSGVVLGVTLRLIYAVDAP